MCDLETSRMGAPYIYDISRLRVKTAPTCFGAVTPSSGSSLPVLAKVTVVKIANYGTSVCGDVAAYISGVRVGECMLHCSEEDWCDCTETFRS